MESLISKYYELTLQSNKLTTTCANVVQYKQLYDELIEEGADPTLLYNVLIQWYQFDLDKHLGLDASARGLQHDIKERRKFYNVQKNWFFVTIGFDDKLITLGELRKLRDKIFSISGVKIRQYVIEKHRLDSSGNIYEHHHCHILIDTDFPKSKVIQYFYQKFKKVVGSKTFIDVKNDGDIDRYEKYISGDKTTEKKVCVELDKKWRQQNNL